MPVIPHYLIWSNEHGGWWKGERMGYTPGLRNAGVYLRDEAIAICKSALPTAMHTKLISEIPVRFEDIAEILKDEFVPAAVMGDSHESRDVIQTPDDARADPEPK